MIAWGHVLSCEVNDISTLMARMKKDDVCLSIDRKEVLSDPEKIEGVDYLAVLGMLSDKNLNRTNRTRPDYFQYFFKVLDLGQLDALIEHLKGFGSVTQTIGMELIGVLYYMRQ